MTDREDAELNRTAESLGASHTNLPHLGGKYSSNRAGEGEVICMGNTWGQSVHLLPFHPHSLCGGIIYMFKVREGGTWV